MIKFKPICVVRSEIKEVKDAPFHWTLSDVEGKIEIFEDFKDGLKGIEKLPYLVILFHFHKSRGYELLQRTPHDDNTHGVFSICSPHRPNSIGMSVVKLLKVEDNVLYVKNIDMIDGTPVLDIKPYIPLNKDK